MEKCVVNRREGREEEARPSFPGIRTVNWAFRSWEGEGAYFAGGTSDAINCRFSLRSGHQATVTP